MREFRVRLAALVPFATIRLRRMRVRSVSLRLALGLVAIAAVGLGWIVHRVRVQQEGIELIRRHGGMYYYDFEYDDANFPTNPRSWAPGWLITTLGIDSVHHVASVRIEDPDFDDKDLGRLTACLPRIESIGIVGTSISDAGLVHLRGNRRLKGLFLGRNHLTDAGIDRLGPETMPVLELLDLCGTGVGDSKIAAVKAIFDARESAARKARPGMQISTHMVLSGDAPQPYLGRNPGGGNYESSISPTPSAPEKPGLPASSKRPADVGRNGQ